MKKEHLLILLIIVIGGLFFYFNPNQAFKNINTVKEEVYNGEVLVRESSDNSQGQLRYQLRVETPNYGAHDSVEFQSVDIINKETNMVVQTQKLNLSNSPYVCSGEHDELAMQKKQYDTDWFTISGQNENTVALSYLYKVRVHVKTGETMAYKDSEIQNVCFQIVNAEESTFLDDDTEPLD